VPHYTIQLVKPSKFHKISQSVEERKLSFKMRVEDPIRLKMHRIGFSLSGRNQIVAG